jgi:hypothetical protein
MSAVSAAEAMLTMSSKIAATARIIGLFPSFHAKIPVRLGRNFFFAKQWRVYRISAHCLGSVQP